MRLEGLTFRAARLEEIDRLSDIINDPPGPVSLKIAGSADKAIRGGRVLCRRGLSLQIEHSTVAELGGEAVGVMDACANRRDVEVGARMILGLLAPVVRAVGPGGLWRLIQSRPALGRVGFDQVPGSFYIHELDIDPRFRNRGIGAEFLRLAEERARAEGCASMSLTTDITNPAQHLYKRTGFEVIETKVDGEFERWSGSPGRVLMVKRLLATATGSALG